MYAPHRPLPYARANTFHGPKRQLLGNQAGYAPPAWRQPNPTVGLTGAQTAKRRQASDPGSKIFLSQLPVDVGEKEVEELFRKTVGPLKESFIVYNSQGKSKGMAVVSFQRAGDAAVARAKYDGKIVDGRRPIKIEIVTEETTQNPHASVPPPPPPPTLFDRIGGAQSPTSLVNGRIDPRSVNNIATSRQSKVRNPVPANNHAKQGPHPPQSTPAILPAMRYRLKKGPRRLQKRHVVVPKSKEQLDKEMEDYRSVADKRKISH